MCNKSSSSMSGFTAALKKARSGGKSPPSEKEPEIDYVKEMDKAVQAAAERLFAFTKKNVIGKKRPRNGAIIFSYAENGESLFQKKYLMPSRDGKKMVFLREDVCHYGHQLWSGPKAFREAREKLPVKNALDRVNEMLTKYNFHDKEVGNYQLGMIDISMHYHDMDIPKEAKQVDDLNVERHEYWGDWWVQSGKGNGSKHNVFAIIPLELNPDEVVNLWHKNTRIRIPNGHPIGTIEPDFLTQKKTQVKKVPEKVPTDEDFPPLGEK